MNIQIWYEQRRIESFAAAWVCWRFLTEKNRSDVVLPVRQEEGEPIPGFNKDTFIYAIQTQNIEKILEKLEHTKLVVIHPKGCWNYFYPSNMPVFLRYVFNSITDPLGKVTRYINTKPRTFKSWDALYSEFETSLDKVILKSNAIHDYIQSLKEELK